MKFPRSIHLDGRRWAVTLVDKDDLDDTWGKKYDAVGDYGDGEIRVWRDLGRTERWRVLLHEMLHIAWEQSRLRERFRGDTEETVVSGMDTVLQQLLAENFGYGERCGATFAAKRRK